MSSLMSLNGQGRFGDMFSNDHGAFGDGPPGGVRHVARFLIFTVTCRLLRTLAC